MVTITGDCLLCFATLSHPTYRPCDTGNLSALTCLFRCCGISPPLSAKSERKSGKGQQSLRECKYGSSARGCAGFRSLLRRSRSACTCTARTTSLALRPTSLEPSKTTGSTSPTWCHCQSFTTVSRSPTSIGPVYAHTQLLRAALPRCHGRTRPASVLLLLLPSAAARCSTTVIPRSLYLQGEHHKQYYSTSSTRVRMLFMCSGLLFASGRSTIGHSLSHILHYTCCCGEIERVL